MSDPVMGHSGTSVPHDTDVKAAKKGEAQVRVQGGRGLLPVCLAAASLAS